MAQRCVIATQAAASRTLRTTSAAESGKSTVSPTLDTNHNTKITKMSPFMNLKPAVLFNIAKRNRRVAHGEAAAFEAREACPRATS